MSDGQNEELERHVEPAKVIEMNGNRPRKLSPADLKKQQQYMEKCQRLINQGVDPRNVDAVIAQQDYEALPLDKKFKRLEQLVMNFSRGIINDVNALRHNDNILSNVYDENLRAMEKIFDRLGITKEDFLKALTEARAESETARAAAGEALQPPAQTEEQAVKAEADEAGEAEPPPAEATEFGG